MMENVNKYNSVPLLINNNVPVKYNVLSVQQTENVNSLNNLINSPIVATPNPSGPAMMTSPLINTPNPQSTVIIASPLINAPNPSGPSMMNSPLLSNPNPSGPSMMNSPLITNPNSSGPNMMNSPFYTNRNPSQTNFINSPLIAAPNPSGPSMINSPLITTPNPNSTFTPFSPMPNVNVESTPILNNTYSPVIGLSIGTPTISSVGNNVTEIIPVNTPIIVNNGTTYKQNAIAENESPLLKMNNNIPTQEANGNGIFDNPIITLSNYDNNGNNTIENVNSTNANSAIITSNSRNTVNSIPKPIPKKGLPNSYYSNTTNTNQLNTQQKQQYKYNNMPQNTTIVGNPQNNINNLNNNSVDTYNNNNNANINNNYNNNISNNNNNYSQYSNNIYARRTNSNQFASPMILSPMSQSANAAAVALLSVSNGRYDSNVVNNAINNSNNSALYHSQSLDAALMDGYQSPVINKAQDKNINSSDDVKFKVPYGSTSSVGSNEEYAEKFFGNSSIMEKLENDDDNKSGIPTFNIPKDGHLLTTDINLSPTQEYDTFSNSSTIHTVDMNYNSSNRQSSVSSISQTSNRQSSSLSTLPQTTNRQLPASSLSHATQNPNGQISASTLPMTSNIQSTVPPQNSQYANRSNSKDPTSNQKNYLRNGNLDKTIDNRKRRNGNNFVEHKGHNSTNVNNKDISLPNIQIMDSEGVSSPSLSNFSSTKNDSETDSLLSNAPKEKKNSYSSSSTSTKKQRKRKGDSNEKGNKKSKSKNKNSFTKSVDVKKYTITAAEAESAREYLSKIKAKAEAEAKLKAKKKNSSDNKPPVKKTLEELEKDFNLMKQRLSFNK